MRSSILYRTWKIQKSRKKKISYLVSYQSVTDWLVFFMYFLLANFLKGHFYSSSTQSLCST